LQAERDELGEDSRNLAEAALKLGRERAALEVQRLEFLERIYEHGTSRR